MKKLFKFLFVLVGVVILLVIVAIVAVPMFFDPNDFKDQIVAQVKDKTGRELKIPGDIKLSVFPWLGVDLGAVELGNAQGFSPDTFARSEQMQVRVKLMPLLEKQVEMDTVTIKGLTLNLAKNAEGGTNWDDLVVQGKSEEPDKDSQGSPIAALAIGGLDISNANLTWDDAQAGQRYEVSQLSVKTGALDLKSPIDLEVAFDVKGGKPAITGHIEVSGQASPDLDAQVYRAKGLTITTDVTGGPVAGGKAKLTLTADAEFDAKNQTFAIRSLKLDGPDVGMDGASGSIALSGQIAGNLKAQTYDVSGLSFEGDLGGAAIPGNKLSFSLGGNVKADLGQQTVAVSDLRLDAPNVGFGDMTGSINLQGQVAGNLGAKTYSVQGLTAKGSVAGGAIKAPLNFDMSADAKADLGNQTVAVSELRLDAPGLKLEGMAGDLFLKIPQIAGNLASKRYDIQGLSLTGKLGGDKIPGEALDLDLRANIAADLANETLSVRELVLKAADMQASGAMDVSQMIKAPAFSGNLNLANVNPQQLLRRLGQPPVNTADGNVLTSLSLRTNLSGTTDQVSFKNLSLKLDDTTVQGDLSAANFKAPMPAVRFALAVDGINADRYLPPKPAGEAQPAATPGAAAGAGAGLPMDTLRALDVDGNLTIGQLKINKLDMSNIKVAVKAQNGNVRVNPVNAALYGGNYAGNIGLDATGSEPRISMDEKLTGIQVEPLLMALQGKSNISGRADVTVNLTAIGVDADSITRTADGQTSFRFSEGALKGVNIARTIREALATFKGSSLPAEQGEQKTDFSVLSATVQLKDGIATNQDFNAKSPLLRIEGAGTVNLVEEQLDYRVKTTIVGTLQGEGGEDLAALSGIPIPVRVTGPFSNPSYQPDIEAIGVALAKSELTKQLNLDKQKAAALAKLEAQKAAALEKLQAQKAELARKAQDAIKEQVGEQLGEQLGEQVGGQIEEQVGEQVEKQAGDAAKKLLKGLFN